MQFEPRITFDSIMVLCPIIEFEPILTFLPNKTLFPNLIFLNFCKLGLLTVKSTASSSEFG